MKLRSRPAGLAIRWLAALTSLRAGTRLRGLAGAPLLAAVSVLACSAAPGDGSRSTSSAFTITPNPNPIPIRLPPPGPVHSPATLAFGQLKSGSHYEETIYFTITSPDDFTASIANSYSGIVHITRMQAWWVAYGCSVGSSDPDCLDEQISGAGTLPVDADEVVAVTVSIDPAPFDLESISTQLVASGTAGWLPEDVPITANVTLIGPNPYVTALSLATEQPIACPGNAEPECSGGTTGWKIELTNIGEAPATYQGVWGTWGPTDSWGGVICATGSQSGPPPCSGTLQPGESTTFQAVGWVSCNATPGTFEPLTVGVAWGSGGNNNHAATVTQDVAIESCNIPVTPGCGGKGEACCNGMCNSGLECQGNTCSSPPPPPPCGVLGQSCCGGTSCNSGLSCQAGLCELPCDTPCYENCGYGCGYPVGYYCPTSLPVGFNDGCTPCCGAQCPSMAECQ